MNTTAPITTISQGDILISPMGTEYKVLGVCGDAVLIEHNKALTKEFFINEGYTLKPAPQAPWEPAVGQKYIYIDSDGEIETSSWEDDTTDIARKSFLGIYPNSPQGREQAEAKIKQIKSL